MSEDDFREAKEEDPGAEPAAEEAHPEGNSMFEMLAPITYVARSYEDRRLLQCDALAALLREPP